MRKLIILLICLAFAAGLFTSCAGKEPVSGGRSVNAAKLSEGTENTSKQSEVAPVTPVPGAESSETLQSIAMRLPVETVSGLRITGSPGHYIFCYTHPKVPAGLHLSVSLRVYKEDGEGDILLESYDSDGAWLADPGRYDPSERTVEQKIGVSGSLEDKYIMVSAKCFGEGLSTFTAAAIRDYAGTVSGGSESVFAWEK